LLHTVRWRCWFVCGRARYVAGRAGYEMGGAWVLFLAGTECSLRHPLQNVSEAHKSSVSYTNQKLSQGANRP